MYSGSIRQADDIRQAEAQFLTEYNNNEDFRSGIRQAVHAIKGVLGHTVVTEEWLAHVAAMQGKCDCDTAYNWDGGYDTDECVHYRANRRAWHLAYNRMSEEELRAQEQAKAEERQREMAEAEERAKQARLEHLRELAKEFNVDPNLLP
jgi:hypothetical protein